MDKETLIGALDTVNVCFQVACVARSGDYLWMQRFDIQNERVGMGARSDVSHPLHAAIAALLFAVNRVMAGEFVDINVIDARNVIKGSFYLARNESGNLEIG